MAKKNEFISIMSCKITEDTEIHVSRCENNGKFVGYYINKKFSVKDADNPNNKVMLFAPNPIRIDTIKELESFSKKLVETIKKEKEKK